MSERIKIMHFVSGLVSGGVEEMLYNYCKFLDRDKYEFIIVYQHDPIPVCKEKFDSLGIHCERITSRKESFIKNVKDSIDLIKRENPDIIHAHMNLMNFCALLAGKVCGVNIRISHSHIAEKTNNIFKQIFFGICKLLCKHYATEFFACGEDAGKFLYGERFYKSGKVNIIPNAIDLSSFQFNERIRENIRSEYNIEDKFVIGHVGRFTSQKNHFRLLNIFSEVLKNKNNSTLLLIGTGELEENVRKKAQELGIYDNIIFLGTTSKMNEVYNAMDVFVLPSLYEGYPVVSIEVQAAQLPSIFSDNIDQTCKLTKYIKFLSLNSDDKDWADSIISISTIRNTGGIQKLYEKFDVRSTKEKLDALYTGYVKKIVGN